MDAKLIQALKNYSRSGYGGTVSPEDQEVVHDFLIKTVYESGVSMEDAARLVHIEGGGQWSKGWTAGYSSAKSHYTPKFSLKRS